KRGFFVWQQRSARIGTLLRARDFESSVYTHYLVLLNVDHSYLRLLSG
ncbi:MAG: hypothetical protein ACI9IA_000074, partial [Enterobacterales bacterium]